MKNLNNLLKFLLENRIDFVLIGGYAGVVHGSTQVTRDLDVCAPLDSEQIQRLRAALKDLHPRHRMNPSFKPSFLEEPKNCKDIKNLYLETDLGVVDLISEVSAIGDFVTVKARAVEIELFGYRCKVISLDDLIKAKESMGRDKDKLAVKELSAIRKKKI